MIPRCHYNAGSRNLCFDSFDIHCICISAVVLRGQRTMRLPRSMTPLSGSRTKEYSMALNNDDRLRGFIVLNSCASFQRLLKEKAHIMHMHIYRGVNKGLYVLLSRTQAEQLSKSRKGFLATTYKLLFTSLYLCTAW